MAFSNSQRTQLAPDGIGRRPYGSFARIPRNPGTLTQLGLCGVPRGRYGSFAGKKSSAAITQLGLAAIPRPRYSSFAGKDEVENTTYYTLLKRSQNTLLRM